jgi:hypothetical protein
MDFYLNTSMDSTYAEKYSTLVCFRPTRLGCDDVIPLKAFYVQCK